MVNIADYIIIRDNDGRWAKFDLPDDDHHLAQQVRRFLLPDNVRVDEAAILSYMLDGVPFGDELDVEYAIRLNDHHIMSQRIKSTQTRGLSDLVGGDILVPRPAHLPEGALGNNRIEFNEVQRRSNGGYLRFYNIVLWFQRTVREP